MFGNQKKEQRLTIVAMIVAKEGKCENVKRELLKLIEPTRSEIGCINYDLHQDNENKNQFIFYENWKNRDLWQDHMNNKHMKSYTTATDGMIEKFILHEMIRIG